jgi:hypothetical protein
VGLQAMNLVNFSLIVVDSLASQGSLIRVVLNFQRHISSDVFD